MSKSPLPTYFLSHGGGPWPYMDGEARRRFDQLERSLVNLRAELRARPRAVLVISGHWEEAGFAVSSAARPGMEYDYYGFPVYLYSICYAAPGHPEVAARVQKLLGNGGLSARLDAHRGFDHGTFSIMKILAPEQDMPIVQLSMDASMDPALHIEAGRLLAPLRNEGILIIGSGSSYHNLRLRDANGTPISRTFDAWLQDVLVHTPPLRRTGRLLRWDEAPPRARAWRIRVKIILYPS